MNRASLEAQQAQQAQAMAPLQQGLAREQLTGAQQENQLRAIQMKDASIMGMAMQRNPGDFNAALDWAMQNGASAPTILSYRQKQAEMAKTMADTQSLQAGAAEKTSNIAKLEDESYDTALGAALRQSKQEGWNPLELRKNFDIQASTNPNPRVGQRLRAFIAGIPQDPTAAQQYLEGGYAKTGAAKQEAEMAKEGAEAAASQATTAEKTQQTRIEKIKADAMEAMKANPQSGLASIDQITPKGPMNGVYKAEYQAAMSMGDMEGAKAAIQHAAEYAARIAQATNPDIIKADVNKAVAVEQATQPLKLQQAVATARAMSGTGPTGNVPPHLAPAAIADYNKSGQALATAQTEADNIQTILDMAEAGNKAAGANAPLVGVGALNAVNGIKRINSAEIHQYGTAGSLLDKIQGKLQGWTEGKPVPNDVLEDMKALHTALAQEAQTKHAREVQSINQSYGSTFEPMQFKARAAASSAPAVGTISKGYRFKGGDPAQQANWEKVNP